MKKWTRAAVLVLAVLLIAGPAISAAPGKKSFRIVLVPERNIFEQQRKYKMLCDYTCRLLPMEFNFEVLKGYAQVLEALKEEKADGAFMGSFIAAYGVDNLDFIPLVRPVWASGTSHYTSYIFKRAGLPITRDVATWEGKSFVFVGPHTTAGYYYPLEILRKSGVGQPAEFFSGIHFAGSHDASVWMVANGMADIGAAKNTIYEEFTKRRPEIGEKVELLYSGGKYPDSTLVVRKDLPAEIRESIRAAFIGMDSNEEGRAALRKFGARKFIRTSSSDFDDVRRVVRESGYDLEKLEVLNQ